MAAITSPSLVLFFVMSITGAGIGFAFAGWLSFHRDGVSRCSVNEPALRESPISYYMGGHRCPRHAKKIRVRTMTTTILW